jgi:hypothetical protein
MFTKTTIALATALILSAGSAALANDIDTAPNATQSERDWRYEHGLGEKHMGNAGTSYGYFGSQQDDVLPGKKNRNR